MKTKNIIAIVIVAILVGLAAFKLMSNKRMVDKNKEFVDRSHIPVSVNVVPVKSMQIVTDFNRSAVIQPNEIAVIAANMPGKLESLTIDLGSKVTAGQVIGKIDTKANDIQVQTLEMVVEKYHSDYIRNEELFQGNALSESNYLDSKFAYDTKRMELEQVRQQISDAYIKSPINGTVIDKRNVAGEFVGPGNPVAIVTDVSILKINVFVNEREVRFIELGQEVKVNSKVLGDEEIKGKVTYISPNTDESFNYRVLVEVVGKEYPQLRAGAYVDVNFYHKGTENTLQIPLKALVEGTKNPYVYIKNGDRAEKRMLKVGRESGDLIEVIDGLKEGELVILDGQANIVDNSLIQIKE